MIDNEEMVNHLAADTDLVTAMVVSEKSRGQDDTGGNLLGCLTLGVIGLLVTWLLI